MIAIIFLKGVIFLNITTFSLSYILLAISIIGFVFFLYFKFLVINTEDKSNRRSKIIGSMKDPTHWRHRNNILAFISLAWALISVMAFVYLKFFYRPELISILFIFIYLALIVLSVSVFLKSNKIVRGK